MQIAAAHENSLHTAQTDVENVQVYTLIQREE